MKTEEMKTEAELMPEKEEKKKSYGAPFLKSKETTATIMRDVVIALIPATAFGVYWLGFRAFLLVLLSITSCVLTEHVCKRIRRTTNGGYECSAIVTGLLLGMMLPVNTPYWFPVAGGIVAIGLVKMLFGGLGRNYLNPAVTAKCVFIALAGPVMNISASGYVTTWNETSLSDLFFGFGVGMIGELSAFLLLLGGAYLLFAKVISWHTPVAYLTSFLLVLAIFGGYGADAESLARQVCTGGIMLGAFFLATDYTTSPMTKSGKLIYGVLLGALTGVLRIAAFATEAVALAVLCGNVLVPLIDKLTVSKTAGKGRRGKRSERSLR